MAGQGERSVDEKMDSGEIQRTGRARSRTLHDMEIDHGGGDIGMAEEVLDGPDVGSGFEKMRRKRVSQGVGGDPLGNARFAHGIADLACGDTTRLS
jgi:hypothetical protein